MQAGIDELLEKRMKRSVGAILGAKEREADIYLPADVSARLRKVILDQFNEYRLLCLDVLGVVDDESIVLNADFLDKIEDIHRAVVPAGT